MSENKTNPQNAAASETTLYQAMRAIGIGNVTTLVNRLGLSVKVSEKAANYAEPNQEYTYVRARELLRLMGLSDKDECARLLVKIGLQGRDMLGEMAKPTITSTPIGRFPVKE